MLPRSSLVPLALGAALFACGSGGDPSAGSEVGGVLVVPDQNNGSSNPYIDGVALGTAGTFVSSGTGQSCGNDSCGYGTGGFALSFAPSVAQAVSFANSGSPEDVALSPSGSFFWGAPQAVLPVSTCTSGVPGVALWSASATASGSQVPVWATFPLVTPSSTGQNCGPGSNDEIVGIVADADAVYVAVAEIPSSNGDGSVVSPDSPCWIQSGQDACGTNELPHVAAPGFVFAVAPGSGGTLQAAPHAVVTTFDPATAIHTLVDAGNSICWLDALAHISCAPKGWATGPAPTPTPQPVPSPPKGWSFVATASSGNTYAWAASPDVAIGATGCLVWASVGGAVPTAVYDGSQADFFCRGLAIDGQYAYVTMNALESNASCNGCSGSSSSYVAGNGVARIPLGGGTLQTIPLESQEWYGPRRVFVDDTYVYAVDPSYVLRVDKTAFGP